MAGREQKIENLLKLIKGEIKPDDLKPKRLCMYIGYSKEPIYSVNEKRVTEDEYNKWAKILPAEHGTGTFGISYGEGNDCEFVKGEDLENLGDE